MSMTPTTEEAKTAAITLTFDPSKLFDVVAEVGDGGTSLGSRIVGIMLTGGQTSFREDVGFAFYGVSAAPASAAPRAGSAESTAGEDAARVIYDICFEPGSERGGGIVPTYDDARSWGLSAADRAKQAAKAVATPAPSSPGVPHSALPPRGTTPNGWRIDVDCALQGLQETAQDLPEQHTAQNPIAAAAGILQAVVNHGYGVFPSSPGVPDSVRAIADRLVVDACELPDRTSPEDQPEMLLITGEELHGFLMQAMQDAIAAHPAGQSTGQGAFGVALERFDAHRLAISQRGPSAKRDELLSELDTIRNSMLHAAKSAPDSTRTGQVETDEAIIAALIEYGAAEFRAGMRTNDEDSSYGAKENAEAAERRQAAFSAISAALVARPAAPEAQGAWRERAATEIDAIARQWGTEGDADGRAYAKTLAAILRAENPAPPASSGQESAR